MTTTEETRRLSLEERLDLAMGLVESGKVEDIANLPTSIPLVTTEGALEERLANEEKEKNSDFQLARKSIGKLIEVGAESAEELAEIAKESGQPKAFESLATLIKSVAESAEKLMGVRQQKKEIERKDGKGNSGPATISVDKAVFVGTTEQLLDKISDGEITEADFQEVK